MGTREGGSLRLAGRADSGNQVAEYNISRIKRAACSVPRSIAFAISEEYRLTSWEIAESWGMAVSRELHRRAPTRGAIHIQSQESADHRSSCCLGTRANLLYTGCATLLLYTDPALTIRNARQSRATGITVVPTASFTALTSGPHQT